MKSFMFALRLAWRDILRNKLRSSLAVILFAAPVSLFLVTMLPLESSNEPSPSPGPAAIAQITHKVCDEQESSEQRPCLTKTDAHLAQMPDIGRLSAVLSSFPQAADTFRPQFNLHVSAEGPNKNNTKVTLTAVDNSPAIYGEIPNEGEVLLNEQDAFILGASPGDSITYTIGGEPRSFKVSTVTTTPSTINQKNLPFDVPERDELRSAQVPDYATTYWVSDQYYDLRTENQQISITGLHKSRGDIKQPLAITEQLLNVSPDDLVISTAMFIVGIALMASIAGPIFTVATKRRLATLGLLASTGATKKHLGLISIAEAVILSSFGVIFGFTITAPLWFGRNDHIWGYFVAIAALGNVSGIVSATLPAIRATKTNTIQALAQSAPMQMRKLRWFHFIAPLIASALLLFPDGAPDSIFVFALLFTVAIIAVLLSAPAFVLSLGKIGNYLPAPERLAIRDMLRNYYRSVPATGAIMCMSFAMIMMTWDGERHSNPENYETSNVIQVLGKITSTTDIPYRPRIDELATKYSMTDEAHAYQFEPTPQYGTATLNIKYNFSGNSEYAPSFRDLVHNNYKFPYSENVLIVDSEILKAFQRMNPGHFTDEQINSAIQALDEGKVVSDSPGLVQDGKVTLNVDLGNLQESHELPGHSLTDSSKTPITAHALISKTTVEKLGYNTAFLSATLSRDTELGFFEKLTLLPNQDTAETKVVVSGEHLEQLIPLRFEALFAAFVAAAIALLVVILAAMESRRDVTLMLTLGATRVGIKRYAAAQGFFVGLLGALGGTLFMGIVRLGSLTNNTTEGFSALYVITIPIFAWLAGVCFGTIMSRKKLLGQRRLT